MRPGLVLAVGFVGASAMAWGDEPVPRQWAGALDLRKAITIKSERVAVDPGGLEAAGVDAGTFDPPRRTKGTRAVYPEVAARAMAQGTVLLDCLIDARGAVEACRVSRSVFPSLDRAAADAIRKWKYEPARVAGEPRGIVVRFMMIFQLQ